MSVARRQLDRFRQEQPLRGGLAVLLKTIKHLLEQNSLMRGVLVKQDEAAIRLEHDVKPADHADEAERDFKQGYGAPESGWRWVGSGGWGGGGWSAINRTTQLCLCVKSRSASSV